MKVARGALLAYGFALALGGCGGGSQSAPRPSPGASAAVRATPRAARPAATVVPIAVVGKRSVRDPFRLTQLRDGRLLYTLFADAMHGHYAGRDTGTSDLVNPHITFVASNGKRLVAVAPAGTVIEKDKTVRMNGGVHARSQDGMTLASDTLRYDDQTELVHGEGHVVVTFPSGERLTGDSVDWNLRSRDIDMNSGRR
jgi:LPS export ABC transporter protein LptC